MNNVLQSFFRLYRPLYQKWTGARRLLRKALFPLQAYLHDGHIQMAPSVRFDHAVVFLGQGQLVLEENIVLGYPLAGSNALPILFEPREPYATIRIGKGTAIVNGCEFIARTCISIGANCRVGARSIFLDADFHGIKPDERNTPGLTTPIIVEDNVWIGNEAMILKGVHVGRDAIIGARCVVTKDVAEGAIVVGNPMKVVGTVYG